MPALYLYVIDMVEYKNNPIIPFKVNPDDSIVDVLQKMGNCSFQGRNLSSAQDIWDKMLSDTKSWGKIAKEANTVTVFSDAAISLPILATALAARRKNKKREYIPKFEMSARIKLET